MARLFVTDINLNKNELQNARIQGLSSAPTGAVPGLIYYNTVDNILYFYNGTEFIPTSGSLEVIQDAINATIVAGVGLDKTYDDGAGTYTLDIDSTVVTLTGTQSLTNKTLTSPVFGGTTTTASGNLVVKPATNILEVQGDGTSVVGQLQLNCHVNSHGQKIASQPHNQNATNTLKLPGGTTIGNADAVLVSDTGTQTLTNKTLTSPVITGLDATTTDKGLASFANADFTVTTGAVTIKNVNLGTQTTGDYVKDIQGTANEITVVPTSGEGAQVTIGLPDDVTITNNLNIGGNLNVTGTINSVNTTQVNIVDNLINLNTDFTGDPTVDAGIRVERGNAADVQLLWNESLDVWQITNDGTNYHAITRKHTAVIGDGVLFSYPVTHNLGSRTVVVNVYDSATYDTVECDVVRTSDTVVTLGFAQAPASGAYTVVIVG